MGVRREGCRCCENPFLCVRFFEGYAPSLPRLRFIRHISEYVALFSSADPTFSAPPRYLTPPLPIPHPLPPPHSMPPPLPPLIQTMHRRISPRNPQPHLPLQLRLRIPQHPLRNQIFPPRIQQSRDEDNGMCVQRRREILRGREEPCRGSIAVG